MTKDLINQSREQMSENPVAKSIKEGTGYGSYTAVFEAGTLKFVDIHYTDKVPAKVHYQPENTSTT